MTLGEDQEIAVAVIRVGLKTFAVSLSLRDLVKPLSACLLSVDQEENFFSGPKLPNDDAIFVASNKRIISLVLSEDGLIEAGETVCLFPTDPLISVCLRGVTLYCLQQRSVSAVKFANSASDVRDTPSKLMEKKVAVPVFRSASKKLTFELPPATQKLRDLTVLPGSTSSNQRVSLPFDVGRARRIFYDKYNHRVLLGGELLNCLTAEEGSFKLSEIRVHCSYFAVATSPSGLILINDAITNDLVILDKTLKEVNRFRGVPDTEAPDGHKYVCHIGKDIVWIAGPARLVKVNYDLSMQEIDIFDQNFLTQYQPTVRLLQAAPGDAYYIVAELAKRGSCLVVCGRETTHVVPLSNIGGESRLT